LVSDWNFATGLRRKRYVGCGAYIRNRKPLRVQVVVDSCEDTIKIDVEVGYIYVDWLGIISGGTFLL
jgi:hypothetical protein